MPTPPTTLVTAAQIARLADVSRATVSNWRRRHPDFPTPIGGTETRPVFDLELVRAWLAQRGQLPPDSPAEDLRGVLRAHQHQPDLVARLWPLLLAAARLGESERKALAELPDRSLSSRAGKLVAAHAATVPGADRVAYRPAEGEAVRALLRCVQQAGPEPTADVLAEPDGASTGTTGTYPTPAPLAELMVDLLTDSTGTFPASVSDPACGAGGLLVAAARRGARTLHGQDLLRSQAMQAAVRVGLADPAATVDVRVGDSLRAPAFGDLAVEAVLCNPPYGLRDWGHEELAYDPRWSYGLPAKGEPELAWVQHCLAALAEGGSAVLLLPPAVSERPSGRRIRAELVRLGALRAVVALPAGIATPWHVGLHLWLLRRPRAQEPPRAQVLFIDATAVDAPAQPGPAGQPVDWSALRRTVVERWQAYADDDFDPVPGLACAVPVIELLDDLVDLTPARHVRAAPTAAAPDRQADATEALRGRLRRTAAALAALSGGAPWPPVGAERRTWRTATVADLLRGGALTLHRAPGGRGGADPTDEPVEIAAGDIILTEVLRHGAQPAEVADAATAGRSLERHRCLLRPDPERFDPWFLAGFLSAEDNVHAASTGTSTVRIDPRRLRVPLLPMAEQRRYGRAFRQLAALRQAADLANRLTAETSRALAAGLTGGALLPPGTAEEADHPDPHPPKGSS